MNTKGVNFQPSERGQFSTAVDTEDDLRVQVVLIKSLAFTIITTPPRCSAKPSNYSASPTAWTTRSQ